MKKLIRVLVPIILILSVTNAWAAGGREKADAADQKFKVSTAIHTVKMYQEGPMKMMEYVERTSNGRITFETFQYPELGSEPDITEMIAVGEIQLGTGMGDVGVNQMFPSTQALSLPFLFSSTKVFVDVLKRDGPLFVELQKRFLDESRGRVRLLSVNKSSSRSLYTTKGPIRTPQDLIDLRIIMRVQSSPYHIALWEGLGTSTVSLPAAERYTALQTGMIDGTEGAFMSAWQAGLMEVQKFATETNHAFGTGYLYINERFYQSLPADLQKIMMEGAWVAAEFDNVNIPKNTIEAKRLMREAGVQIYEPTLREMEQWRNKAIPVGRRFVEQGGVDPAFVDMVLKLVAETEAKQ